MLHGVEVQEQVRHVLQLPEVIGRCEDVADALQSHLAVLGVVLVIDVRAQLRDARVPQLALLAVELPVRVGEEGKVILLVVTAIASSDLNVSGT